jgi:hypothetical protein
LSKVLATAAEIVGAVALVATGVGALGSLGIISSASAVATTAATVAHVAALATVALTAVSQFVGPKPPAVSPIAWKADPQAGIPYAMGQGYVGGNIVYRMAYGDNNVYQTLVTVLSGGGPHQSLDTLYVDNVACSIGGDHSVNIPDSGYMYANTQLGLTPEPRSILVPPIDPYAWDADCTLSGYAATIVTLKYDTKGKATMTTTPQVGWYGHWAKVYDPRKDSTYPGGSGSHRSNDETTWEWSENPYLHALTWLIGRRQNGKLVLGVGAPLTGVVVDDFVQGANVADANGWTMFGVVYSTDDKWNCLKLMLQAGGGIPLRLGAQIGCYVNTPKVSLATISASDVIGQASVQATQGKRDRINAVVPRYIVELDVTQVVNNANTTTKTWEMTAASPVIVPEYVTFDGKTRQREVEYSFVTQLNQAVQLARYEIENAREFGPITLPLKLRWMGYKPGDVVTADIPELGLNGQDILIMNRSLSPHDGSVTLTARSETTAKHAFALGQTGTPPATPSISGPPLIPTPGSAAWALVGGTITAPNGATFPVLQISGAVDSGVIDAIVFEYRISADGQDEAANWILYDAAPPSTQLLDITGLQDGTAYDVAVSYRMGPGTGDRLILGPAVCGQTAVPWQTGVIGDGKPDDGATAGAPAGTYVAGVLAEDLVQMAANQGTADTTPPAIPRGLAATSSLNTAGTTDVTVIWTQNTETDLASYDLGVSTNGGNYVYYPVASNLYYFNGILPNTPMSFEVRARDKTGNVSGYCLPYSITTAKDTTPPAPPTNLTAAPVGLSTIQLNWLNPADLDLAGIEVWSSATNDVTAATKLATVNGVPNGTGAFPVTGIQSGATRYFWLKALDTSGNESAFTAVVQGQASTDSVASLDIAPGAVIASKLGIAGPILFPDQKVQDASFWDQANQLVLQPVGGVPLSATGYRVPAAGAWAIDNDAAHAQSNTTNTGATACWVLSDAAFTGAPPYGPHSTANEQLVAPALQGVQPGVWYEFASVICSEAGSAPCNRDVQMVVQWFEGDGNYLTADALIGTVAAGSGPLQQVVAKAQAPATAAAYRIFWACLPVSGATNFAGYVAISSITARQCATGELIVDGSITGTNIAGQTITGENIEGGTFTGAEFASNASLPATMTIGPEGFELGTIQQSVAAGNIGSNRIANSDGSTATGWFVNDNPSGQPTSVQAGIYQRLPFINTNGTATAAGQEFSNSQQWNLPTPQASPYQFNVTAGEYLSAQVVIGGNNLAQQQLYIYFSDVDGNNFTSMDVGQTSIPTTSLIFGTVLGGFVTVPAGAVRAFIIVYGIAIAAGPWTITVAQPMVAGATPGQTVLPPWSPGPMVDPASVINSNTTKVNAGQILIAGSTTLDDWRYGPDLTEINGGNIAANTIEVNTATIGLRGVQTIGIYFDTDRSNTVTWSAGYVEWYDEAFNRQVTLVNGGACARTLNSTGVMYVWFDRSASPTAQALYWGETSAAAVLANPNNVILAMYWGGTELQVGYGQTIVDGSNIHTGTVTATQVATQTLVADNIVDNSLTAWAVFHSGSTYFGDSGSGSSGGGITTPTCVATSSFMPGTLLAGDMVPGAGLLMLSDDDEGYFLDTAEKVLFARERCFRITVEGGATLIASISTPITTRNRMVIPIEYSLGCEVPVLDQGVFSWQRIVGLDDVGEHDVALISARDGTYAAGEQADRFIFTHNKTTG